MWAHNQDAQLPDMLSNNENSTLNRHDQHESEQCNIWQSGTALHELAYLNVVFAGLGPVKH